MGGGRQDAAEILAAAEELNSPEVVEWQKRPEEGHRVIDKLALKLSAAAEDDD
jgi:hypothetical protein